MLSASNPSSALSSLRGLQRGFFSKKSSQWTLVACSYNEVWEVLKPGAGTSHWYQTTAGNNRFQDFQDPILTAATFTRVLHGILELFQTLRSLEVNINSLCDIIGSPTRRRYDERREFSSLLTRRRIDECRVSLTRLEKQDSKMLPKPNKITVDRYPAVYALCVRVPEPTESPLIGSLVCRSLCRCVLLFVLRSGSLLSLTGHLGVGDCDDGHGAARCGAAATTV